MKDAVALLGDTDEASAWLSGPGWKVDCKTDNPDAVSDDADDNSPWLSWPEPPVSDVGLEHTDVDDYIDLLLEAEMSNNYILAARLCGKQVLRMLEVDILANNKDPGARTVQMWSAYVQLLAAGQNLVWKHKLHESSSDIERLKRLIKQRTELLADLPVA